MSAASHDPQLFTCVDMQHPCKSELHINQSTDTQLPIHTTNSSGCDFLVLRSSFPSSTAVAPLWYRVMIPRTIALHVSVCAWLFTIQQDKCNEVCYDYLLDFPSDEWLYSKHRIKVEKLNLVQAAHRPVEMQESICTTVLRKVLSFLHHIKLHKIF